MKLLLTIVILLLAFGIAWVHDETYKEEVKPVVLACPVCWYCTDEVAERACDEYRKNRQ